MSLAKKKRISKKNKSAWRKTDIQDVEEFLEEQRQEERIGSFADKSNDELFIIDVPTQTKRSVLSEKQKRKLNATTKPLRSHLALENTSKVADPIAKRNIVRQKMNGRNIEQEVYNPTKPRHFQANKDRALHYAKIDARVEEKTTRQKANKDLWLEQDFRDKLPGLKDEKGWISRELALHVVGNAGKKVVKVHDSIRHKTTKAKKFEPPHPGMSYNPSLEAHSDLISKVVGREEKIIKEEKHLKRVTTSMFSKVTAEERDQRLFMEMSEGMDENEDNGNNEDTEHNLSKHGKGNKASGSSGSAKQEEAPYAANAPVENKKKSKQARRKELKQKELQRRQEAKQALKKQTVDLNRIKSIKAEVLSEAEKLNQLKKHRKSVAEKKKFEPKRLGRHKFVEPDMDVNMPDDIAGNLRNLKTESNLITDRFKNFQKRNILPTTIAVSRKKAKVKRFVRNSHKEPGVSYQMLREQRRAAAKASRDVIKV